MFFTISRSLSMRGEKTYIFCNGVSFQKLKYYLKGIGNTIAHFNRFKFFPHVTGGFYVRLMEYRFTPGFLPSSTSLPGSPGREFIPARGNFFYFIHSFFKIEDYLK